MALQFKEVAAESGEIEQAVPPAERRRLRLVPRWFLTLIGTRLSLAGTVALLIIILAAIFASRIARYAPDAMNAPLAQPPTLAHPFGTNDAGQDIFSQVLYGARFSLAIGGLTGVSVTALAILIGMAAGYIGGWLDDLLSMIMNVFLIVPQLPLIIVVSAYINLRGDEPVATVLVMSFVITITGWAWGGRVMRSQTLSLRHRDFVDAAIVSGESTARIIFRDVLPNMLALIVNTVILSSMGAILAETSLDFLGVGATNQVTWGTMLNYAQANETLYSGEWWSFVFPGCAIALTIMCLILMNNGVDVLSNPRLRRIRAPRGRRRRLRLPSRPASRVEPEAAL